MVWSVTTCDSKLHDFRKFARFTGSWCGSNLLLKSCDSNEEVTPTASGQVRRSHASVAQETAGLATEAVEVGQTDVIIGQDVCVLECSEEDRVDGWLAEVIGQRCRELNTAGDGACAMHATFWQGGPCAS